MKPVVGIVMGSRSDWDTLRPAAETLDKLGVAHEVRVVSAHRTPDLLFEYATTAEPRGIKVIIAGAGGAAHLPGMLAAKTTLPVLGVPVQSKALNGLDSLLSIVQMPAGIPVPTFAIAGLPAWASLNATTGVLSGTPPDTTGSPLTLTVTATNPAVTTQTFTLTILPAVTAPAIATQPQAAVATAAAQQRPLRPRSAPGRHRGCGRARSHPWRHARRPP